MWPNATTTVNIMGAGDPANDIGWPAFNGNFADVRMYNSSLSANDVLNVLTGIHACAACQALSDLGVYV